MAEERELGLWDVLSAAQRAQCPECGAPNALSDEVCVECGAALELEEEAHTALDVGEGGAGADPMTNLKKLELAREGILYETLDAETYRGMVAPVAQLARMAAELLQSAAAEKVMAGRPAEEVALVEASVRGLKDLRAGSEQMLAFLDTGDSGDLEEGYRRAREAMESISRSKASSDRLAEQERIAAASEQT